MKNLGNEIWKDIPGYEGLYQVSNLGRVKSLNYNHTGKPKILKQTKNKNGYYGLGLWKNGEGVYKRVNRLVAETFIPNPLNLPQVNHKNLDRTDNRVDNLEWITCKDNIRYSNSKKVACYYGDNLVKIYESTHEPEEDGFKQSNVYFCCVGKLKKYKGYTFKFLSI